MSLLLKALKQAETAHAGKAQPVDPELALESLQTDTAKAREWLEPPGLLFGNSSVPPTPVRVRRPRLPQLSLVPATALLAAIVALGYGVYLYYELQPPASVVVPAPPTPPRASGVAVIAPLPTQAPIVSTTSPPPTPAQIPAANPAVSSLPAASPQTSPEVHGKPALTDGPGLPGTSAHPARAAPDSRPSSPRYALQASSNNLLNNAYEAYQRGDIDEAQRLYMQAAARERSVDALLGLAAIAGMRNRDEDAARLYREVLERDPHNASAQAALLDLLGNTDRQATESRLKMLIDRTPSASLYQTLGNLYADQQRWSDAQIAYFEAWRLAPSNADYAFNLAVSLDRLQQAQAALGYYEKALTLDGHSRFDRAQAELRLRQIRAAQP